jgi:hypothetical protein
MEVNSWSGKRLVPCPVGTCNGYAATEVVRSGTSDSIARPTHPMIERMGEADAIGAPAPGAPASPANNIGVSTH